MGVDLGPEGPRRGDGNSMELGRLEAFVQVANLLSFSRAADALFLTQPTVTARIQALERELGEPLFERTGRAVRLTDAGREFLPHVQRALQAVKDGNDAIASARDVERGTLSVGTAPTIGAYVLPALLQQFAARYPGVEISIRTGRSDEILEMLLADEVQVGIERHRTHADITTVALYEDDIYLVASSDHPIVQPGAVTVPRIGREAVIFFDVGSSYHAISQAIFHDAGVTPRHTLEVDSLEMAKHLVLKGLGLAFLPRVAVEHDLAEGSLVRVEIEGRPPLRRQIALMYRQRRLQSRSMLAFFDLLNEIYRVASPDSADGAAPAAEPARPLAPVRRD